MIKKNVDPNKLFYTTVSLNSVTPVNTGEIVKSKKEMKQINLKTDLFCYFFFCVCVYV